MSTPLWGETTAIAMVAVDRGGWEELSNTFANTNEWVVGDDNEDQLMWLRLNNPTMQQCSCDTTLRRSAHLCGLVV